MYNKLLKENSNNNNSLFTNLQEKNKNLDNFVNLINENNNKKKKTDGMRSVRKRADNNPKVTKMDFLPDDVLDSIAKEKSLDEFVENLDERKKRKKKYTAKNIPNNYKSKVSSKARSSMAREMNKCAKTPRPKSCYDYWDADKKHDKAMSESIDRFVEMLYEKKLSKKTRDTLKKKAEKANMPLGALTSVYRKGLGAWLTGHRPGTPQHAWAMARVNSFIRGGKTRSVDKAEWKKVQKHRKNK